MPSVCLSVCVHFPGSESSQISRHAWRDWSGLDRIAPDREKRGYKQPTQVEVGYLALGLLVYGLVVSIDICACMRTHTRRMDI